MVNPIHNPTKCGLVARTHHLYSRHGPKGLPLGRSGSPHLLGIKGGEVDACPAVSIGRLLTLVFRLAESNSRGEPRGGQWLSGRCFPKI